MEYWEWQGERYEAMDPDDWTIRTLREVERHLGAPYATTVGADRYLAIAFGVIYRSDPSVQWDELEAKLTPRAVGRLVDAMAATLDAADDPKDGPPAEAQTPRAVEVTGTVQLPAAVSDSPGAQPAPMAGEVLSPTSAGSSASE